MATGSDSGILKYFKPQSSSSSGLKLPDPTGPLSKLFNLRRLK